MQEKNKFWVGNYVIHTTLKQGKISESKCECRNKCNWKLFEERQSFSIVHSFKFSTPKVTTNYIKIHSRTNLDGFLWINMKKRLHVLFLNIRVVYICASLLHLALESRDLSQTEKKICCYKLSNFSKWHSKCS